MTVWAQLSNTSSMFFIQESPRESMTRRDILQHNKSYLWQTRLQHHPKCRKLEANPLESEPWQGYPLSLLLFNIVLKYFLDQWDKRRIPRTSDIGLRGLELDLIWKFPLWDICTLLKEGRQPVDLPTYGIYEPQQWPAWQDILKI